MKDLGSITISTKYNLVRYPSGFHAVNPDTGIIEYGGSTIENLMSAIELSTGISTTEISFGSPVRVALEMEKDKCSTLD
jgi:hypothetical protein